MATTLVRALWQSVGELATGNPSKAKMAAPPPSDSEEDSESECGEPERGTVGRGGSGLPDEAALEEARKRVNREFNVLGEAYPELADMACPLTKCLMTDPVRAKDGFVYERARLQEWIGGELSGWDKVASAELLGQGRLFEEESSTDDSEAVETATRSVLQTAQRQARVVLSPKTREPMGTELRSEVELRNATRSLLRRVAEAGPARGVEESIKLHWAPRGAQTGPRALDFVPPRYFSAPDAGEVHEDASSSSSSSSGGASSSSSGKEASGGERNSGGAAKGVEDSEKAPSSSSEFARSNSKEEAQQEQQEEESCGGGADLSVALSRVFRELDEVRGVLKSTLDNWEPPKVVVIGDESVGKSTVLEQLCQLPLFPRRRRFCTKVKILVRLRRTLPPEEGREAAAALTATLAVRRVSDCFVLEEHVIPIENSFRYVQDKMDELAKSTSSDPSEGVVSDKELVLDLKHPSVPTIDLVDLPGLVQADRERPRRPERTKHILRRQVQDDEASGCNAFYVAIVPASGDVRPSCNAAMDFVCAENLAEKTFGVFSKCDQLAEDSTDILRSLVLGVPTNDGEPASEIGRVELTRGWVASMLKPPAPAPPAPAAYYETHNYERLLTQKRNETAYFRDSADPILGELYRAGHCGVPALVTRLEHHYNDYLHTTWKRQTLSKIKAKRCDLTFKRDLLGHEEDSSAEAAAAARAEAARRLEDPAIRRAGLDDFWRALNADLLPALEKLFGNNPQATCDLDACAIDDFLAVVAARFETGIEEAIAIAEVKWVVTIDAVLNVKLDAAVGNNNGNSDDDDDQGRDTWNLPVNLFLQHAFDTVKHSFLAGSFRTKWLSHLGLQGAGTTRRQVGETLRTRSFVQIANYESFTRTVAAKCRAAFEIAKQAIIDDLKCFVKVAFLDLGNQSYIDVHPVLTCDRAVAVVSVNKGFVNLLNRALVSAMRHMPTPAALVATCAETPLGRETSQVADQRRDLDKEIANLAKACRGVIRALDISDAEVAAQGYLSDFPPHA